MKLLVSRQWLGLSHVYIPSIQEREESAENFQLLYTELHEWTVALIEI